MNAEAPALAALGARAHCDRHSPGQRQNVETLVAWQSRSGDRYASADGVRAPTGWRAPQQALGATAAGPDTRGAQRLAPAALAWQPPTAADGPCALGSLDLWTTLPDDVEWLDLTLSVHRQGRWWRLHPELLDSGADAHAMPRLLVVLPDDELQALAALGIEIGVLRATAAQPDTACWCCRLDGLGAFVAGLVDLGWPAPPALA